MAIAALTAELHDAGVPTHRPAIKSLIARKAFERAQANPADMVQFLREHIDGLGGHLKAALFDGLASDLRKDFGDDTADLANDLADAIRFDLSADAEKPLGRESASWRSDMA